MRIIFVITVLDMSGGVRVVREYAQYLAARGHEVTIVNHSLPPRPWRARLRSASRNIDAGKPARHVPTFAVDPRVCVKRVDVQRHGWAKQVPDGDVVIATWWLSCEHVAVLPPSKGHKVHFVQGHEVFAERSPQRVKESIRLIPTKITVSQWLTDLMREEYGLKDTYLVRNGVDTTRFRAPERTQNLPPVVGTVYSDVQVKNSTMAWDAVLLARQPIPDLKFLAFGTAPPPLAMQKQDWAKYYNLPSPEEIPLLYASCDAWLFTSHSEGFGLPVLEALACGTPVIATAAGAAPDLINAGNGALVETAPGAMAKEIIRICNLPQDEWALLSRGAAATGAAHSLELSGEAFEAALVAISGITTIGQ